MRFAWVILSSVGIVACGGDEGDTAPTGTTGGGSNGPRGALSVEVYRSDVASCPWASTLLQIGNVKASPPSLVADGEGGASMACTVAPHGGPFAAQGQLSQGATSFGFDDLVSDGGSATGTISFVDPEGAAHFASAVGSPCVFQFAPGSDQGIGEGHVHVQFDCSKVVSEADPNVVCAARYGYVAVEGCATTEM